MQTQRSYSACAQPMRDKRYIVTSSLIGWKCQTLKIFPAIPCWKCIFEYFLEFQSWFYAEILMVLPYFPLFLQFFIGGPRAESEVLVNRFISAYSASLISPCITDNYLMNQSVHHLQAFQKVYSWCPHFYSRSASSSSYWWHTVRVLQVGPFIGRTLKSKVWLAAPFLYWKLFTL